MFVISISKYDFISFSRELAKQCAQNHIHNIDKTIDLDKCQSIEQLATNGDDVLLKARFKHDYFDGPCLLLRRENGLENGFILVGCMTTLSHSSQRYAFSRIPNLRSCKFIKYGRMHRNTFINAPKVLNEFFQIKNTNAFIIGQLSGLDGYAPAIASGVVAALRIIYGNIMPPIPLNTMVGGLVRYVSNQAVRDFQPMCASFSLIKEPTENTAEIVSEYMSTFFEKQTVLLDLQIHYD